VCFSAFGSNRSTPNPPVPYFAACAGSFDRGSPPWMIPIAITRWNVVPLYAPSRARVMK
jgi:hypothetical protein